MFSQGDGRTTGTAVISRHLMPLSAGRTHSSQKSHRPLRAHGTSDTSHTRLLTVMGPCEGTRTATTGTRASGKITACRLGRSPTELKGRLPRTHQGTRQRRDTCSRPVGGNHRDAGRSRAASQRGALKDGKIWQKHGIGFFHGRRT